MQTIAVSCRLPIGKFQFSCSLVMSRPTTVFEEMILRIIDNFQKNVRLCGATIRAIFEKVLHLKDVDILLKVTLDELCSPLMKILRKKRPEVPVLKMPISDFEILENGRKMLAFGKIPGLVTQKEFVFFYNFITQKMVSEENVLPYDEKMTGVPKETFRNIFPFEEFEKEIRKAETISELEVSDPQLLEEVSFHQSQVNVQMNLADGNLVLSTKDSAIQSYLQHLKPEIVRRAFFPTEKPARMVSNEIVNLRQATWKDCFLPGNLPTIPDSSILIHGQNHGFPVHNTPILEVFSEPGAKPALVLAEDGNSAKLTLPAKDPWEQNGISNLHEYWEIVQAKVWFNENPLLVPLGILRPHLPEEREALLRRILEAILKSSAPEKFVWADFVVRSENLPDGFWNSIYEELREAERCEKRKWKIW